METSDTLIVSYTFTHLGAHGQSAHVGFMNAEQRFSKLLFMLNGAAILKLNYIFDSMKLKYVIKIYLDVHFQV